MNQEQKSILSALSIFLICSVSACGGVKGTNAKTDQTSAKNEIIYDSCAVSGNKESFDVTCTKNIETFQMGSSKVGIGLNIMEGGKTTLIEKNGPQSLKGSAPGHADKLEIEIHHSDGTKSDIIVS